MIRYTLQVGLCFLLILQKQLVIAEKIDSFPLDSKFELNDNFEASDNEDNISILRMQISPFTFGFGSVYNNFSDGIFAFKTDYYMLSGAVIPEFQYSSSYGNIFNSSGENDKFYSELKLGAKLGIPGRSTFYGLKCVDRVDEAGNKSTTYYEQDKVEGNSSTGLSLGLFRYRSNVNPFEKEYSMYGPINFYANCVYGGIYLLKYADNSSKKYKSGNECVWDAYQNIYAQALYAFSANVASDFASTSQQTFPSYYYMDQFRQWTRTGLIIGYEKGSYRSGFVSTFELGILPGFKGRTFCFKTGFNFVFGL